MEFVNNKLIEINEFLQEKKIAILGVNYSNVKLIEYLYNIQADDVTVFDLREIEHINGDLMNKVITCGMEYEVGSNCLRKLSGFDIIFRAPNYYPSIPEIVSEAIRGTIVTSELELFMDICPGKIIAVAGTDGKMTTSVLICEILKAGGYKAYIGGIDEYPLFSKLEEMNPDDYIVLSLSNQQLINMKISPDVSIITDIEESDLKIDYSFEEYINNLKNMYLNQKENDVLILNYDNEILREFEKDAKSKITYFGQNKIEHGYMVDENKIKFCEAELRIHLLDTRNLNIRGIHNFKNATAAIIATSDLVDLETSISTIKEFVGLENRLELIYETEDRISWYNDSASIKPSRTISALDSFLIRNIILIIGGDINEYNYEKLGKQIVNSCKDLILIGENFEIIEEAIKPNLRNTSNKVNIYKINSLEEAIKLAKKVAVKGDVVLFSPAGEQKSKYKDFKQAGKEFKKILYSLYE